MIVNEIIDGLYPEMKHQEMIYYISEIEKHPEIIIDRFEHNDTYVIQIGVTAKKFMEKADL